MKKFRFSLLAVLLIGLMSSCTSYNLSMREPNSRVMFDRNDFDLSGQVTGEAKRTTVLMIDFARLFTQRSGGVEGGGSGIDFSSIPVVGSFITDPTASYALYEMMEKNPGYDVVFYPQYSTKVSRPILGIGFLLKTTTVKASARLGKMK